MADLKGKRVLVTGGAGFIGSHIIDLLCDEGYVEIVALDNMVRGRPANLKRASTRGPVCLVHGDIRDAKLMAPLVKAAPSRIKTGLPSPSSVAPHTPDTCIKGSRNARTSSQADTTRSCSARSRLPTPRTPASTKPL